MKKMNVLWGVLIAFGGVSAYEVIVRFGWQAVDLPPHEFFYYSLFVAVRNFITYTLAFLSIPFLFGRYGRWLLLLLFGYVLTIEGAFCVANIFHADLASVWLDLVLDTNIDEIVYFIKMLASIRTVIVLGMFAAIFIGIGLIIMRAKYPLFSKRSLAIGGALLLPFFIFNIVLMNWHFGVAQMNYSSFVISSIQSYRKMRGVRDACLRPKLPVSVSTKVMVEELPDVVFVIGESSTRNNWNLYGYARLTTPRMNEICQVGGGGFCYSDVVGTQPDTVNALGLLLTDVEFDRREIGNWTVAEVYRRAGFRCVLISNQSSWGDDSSPLAQLFNGCERRVCMSKECSGKCFDGQMIPFLEKALNEERDSRPTLVFVHLAGMHFPVQNVTPLEDSYYTDNIENSVLVGLSERDRDRRNRYDDAVRYEDKVLGGIVDVLRSCHRPCCMFFCSDHGESPRAPNWRDYEDKDVYAVPSLFWFSVEYAKRFPQTVSLVANARDKKLQQDQLTYGLLSLGQIDFWTEDMEKRNFLHADFKGRYPRLINKGRQTYPED